ncbi:RNA pseudouridine synthase [Rheinheimera baltica]|uniref:Pseudouridine synthase n=1 Tax=Rheinheimera baltica TaxID=67576 RepID=A0ABT9HZP9_9GAMM|nr:RNA pseudouridine synthase [Rheinheimera baltica]MDP5136615.1 RNA pseudouridine synthase [Rheinheimera baltica]MDP5144076.1 RNA pseudouridine synthase [Rheinheimera baltica]
MTQHKQAEQHRLAKWIARSGFCSRRAAERLITAGRVSVNNTLAGHTLQVSQHDLVCIDQQPLAAPPPLHYVLYHKPVGIDCNVKADNPASLYQLIHHLPHRLFAVGRLDKDSSGLLLLTNDGALSQQLMHPDFLHEKAYLVETDKSIDAQFIQQMASGVSWQVGERHYQSRPCNVIALGEKQFHITLTQGLHRQIRYMSKACGYKVTALKRIRLDCIELGNLAVGAMRDLTASELQQLQALRLNVQPDTEQ